MKTDDSSPPSQKKLGIRAIVDLIIQNLKNQVTIKKYKTFACKLTSLLHYTFTKQKPNTWVVVVKTIGMLEINLV